VKARLFWYSFAISSLSQLEVFQQIRTGLIMSQWFGGQGRKGGKTNPEDSSGFSRGRASRPIRPGSEPQSVRPQPKNFQQESSKGWNPDLAREADDDISFSDNRVNSHPYQDYEQEEQADFGNEDQNEVEDEPAVQIEFKKRLVALIIDFMVFYVVTCGIMLVPFLNAYLSVNPVLCLLLLFRDVLFQGRGVGKNLMGLQVVDADTGGAPTLKQAALRNIVLFGPYLVIQVVGIILHFIPVNTVNQIVITIMNAVCAVYVIIVIPMEVYRAYNRPDGRRFGDELARTEVVDSNMDFSQPLPARRARPARR